MGELRGGLRIPGILSQLSLSSVGLILLLTLSEEYKLRQHIPPHTATDFSGSLLVSHIMNSLVHRLIIKSFP